MHAIILFLSLTSSAFAKEPTTTPTATSVAVRDAYKASLLVQLEKSGEDEAEGKCGAAKSSYRSAESVLTGIYAELAFPANSVIGQVQVDYRAKLEALKRNEEAKIAKAKTNAKTAGTELTSAKAKVKAIEAEIARIDISMGDKVLMQKQQLDKEISDNAGILGALRDRSDSTSVRGLAVPLPVEFKSCFPSEVSS